MECATASALSSPALPLSCSGLRRSPLARQLKWAEPKRNYSRKRHAFVQAQLDLKPPPYSLNALEPHMSHQTLEYHWGKHHRAYVDNLNKQIAGTELEGMSLEEIIITTYNKGDPLPPFNNAAQKHDVLTRTYDEELRVQMRNREQTFVQHPGFAKVGSLYVIHSWNHNFFWESMKPGGGGLPTGILLELIERDFGSFDAFLREFKAAATTQFGSGWAWLSYKASRLAVGNAVNPLPTEKDNKLVISKSPNAVNPLVWDYTPLLTIDVWEHAYYLDYEYKRPEYVSTFIKHLVSWESVSARLETAKAKAEERARAEEEMRRKEETEELENSEPVEMYMENEAEGSDSE